MSYYESLEDGQMLELLNDQMQQDGVLAKLKLQVRTEIIEKLQGQNKNAKVSRNFDQKVMDCAIANFLNVHQFYCTYQLFVSESQLLQKELLNTQELLQLNSLQLRDYEEYINQLDENSVSAIEIMTKMLKKRFHIEKEDHSCQTEDKEETYQQKMYKLEKNYLKKIDYSRLTDMQGIEERMNNYKKQAELKYQAQLQSEISRLREFEIDSMRLEERARYEKQLKTIQQGSPDYNQKLYELKKKEEEAMTRIRLRMKEIEKEAQIKRQEIQHQLDELEKEKIKYHRHKCLESELVQNELKELEGIKLTLQKEIKEYQVSRQAIDKENLKQTELIQQFWKDKQSKQVQEAEYNQKKDVDSDWIAYQKDSCGRLQQQREYLTQENEILRTEIADLQYKIKEMTKEMDKCREDILRAKDERDIEHNYNMRLEGQLRLLQNMKEF